MMPHLKAPECPACHSQLRLTVSVEDRFVMLWKCRGCGIVHNHATGAITDIAARNPKSLKYLGVEN